jgi:hypothetical protein
MANLRKTSIESGKEEFREIGYYLVDAIADFLDGIKQKPVTFR